MTTLDKKLHIAGEPTGLKQRCTRCGALLTDNTTTPELSFWRTGGLVMSWRYGKSIVEDPAVALQIRPCG